ncbi:MAG: nitroreductase family protein [Candidatus Heimdallarchaeota archaeon]|nr:MAG: nitroreductase family protein [Candidatus Heimdallarchaeota archaeon]
MQLEELIRNRRSYRALEPTEITKELIEETAKLAQLAPSCFNNQPWRYIFVYERETLTELHRALSKGNEWAKAASMIIVVFSRKDFDCDLKKNDIRYYQFDTGMATAFMILRLTELGLVAHPIAGFSADETKTILGIPEDMKVITWVIVGKKSEAETLPDFFRDHQKKSEKERPARKELEEFVFFNKYTNTT